MAGLEAAVAGGAARIEVCSRLDLYGLTPSAELLEAAIATKIPCVAMIACLLTLSMSLMFFGCDLFWIDKCDHALFEWLTFRVNRFNHMNVSGTRRDSQSIGAEHRHNVQVLTAILDNHRSPKGKRFGQRSIDNDLRWELAGERDNWDGATLVRCALCHRGRCPQHDGSDR
jgi:hypothetical protein